MHVFQTAGVPPKRGRIMAPNMSSMKNSKAALRNSVAEKSTGMSGSPW